MRFHKTKCLRGFNNALTDGLKSLHTGLDCLHTRGCTFTRVALFV